MQLFSTDYPAEIVISAEDNILYNAQYYIHFLARNSHVPAAAADNDDDANVDDVTDYKDDSDDDCRHLISLNELLTFQSLRNACEGDVNFLR